MQTYRQQRLWIGVGTLTAAMLAGLYSFLLYSTGAPGTPEMEASNDHIAVYSPPNVEVKFTLASSPAPSVDVSTRSFLVIDWKSEQSDRFHLVFDLDESARGTDYSTDNEHARISQIHLASEGKWNDDNDYIIVEVTPDGQSRAGQFHVGFNMTNNPIVAENARFLTATPNLRVEECPNMDDIAHVIFGRSQRLEFDQNCTTGSNDQVGFTVLWPGPGPIRSDYAQPQALPKWSPQAYFSEFASERTVFVSW